MVLFVINAFIDARPLTVKSLVIVTLANGTITWPVPFALRFRSLLPTVVVTEFPEIRISLNCASPLTEMVPVTFMLPVCVNDPVCTTLPV